MYLALQEIKQSQIKLISTTFSHNKYFFDLNTEEIYEKFNEKEINEKFMSHGPLLQGNMCQHTLVWIFLIIVKCAAYLKKKKGCCISVHSSTVNTPYFYYS